MNKKFFTAAILIAVLAINFGFGFPRLDKFSAVDEPYWTYGRISKFWDSVAASKWRSTNVNDKPGITVALLSGFGLTKIDPMSYKDLRNDPKTDEQLAAIHTINFSFRLPIFLFALASLLLFYFLLRKLFNEQTALLAFIGIGLSPILLGISLIINPDSLLWIFLPLSLLAYFNYQKYGDKRYLYGSGVLFGLSLLTKYVANILYVFYFLLPFIEYVLRKDKPTLATYLKKSALDYAILVAISMATFFILFPAAWVSPGVLLKGTLLSKAFSSTWPLFAGVIGLVTLDHFAFANRSTHLVLDFAIKYRRIIISGIIGIFSLAALFVFVNTYLGMRFYDFPGIVNSPKGIGGDPIGAIFGDFYSLIFGLPPVILLALFFALYRMIREKNTVSDEARISVSFLVFILFYYLASTVNDVVATIRYQIILYPLAIIIGAIGMSWIIENNRIKKYVSFPLAATALIVVLAGSLYSVRPFYFSYASDLLPKQYLLNLKDMGDGSYEAADYLNHLPNAHALTIWSDKGAVCQEFIGKCVIGFKKQDLGSITFNYFVTSTGRESRTFKLSGGAGEHIDFRKAYLTDDVVTKIAVTDRPDNFIKIVDGTKIMK